MHYIRSPLFYTNYRSDVKFIPLFHKRWQFLTNKSESLSFASVNGSISAKRESLTQKMLPLLPGRSEGNVFTLARAQRRYLYCHMEAEVAFFKDAGLTSKAKRMQWKTFRYLNTKKHQVVMGFIRALVLGLVLRKM